MREKWVIIQDRDLQRLHCAVGVVTKMVSFRYRRDKSGRALYVCGGKRPQGFLTRSVRFPMTTLWDGLYQVGSGRRNQTDYPGAAGGLRVWWKAVPRENRFVEQEVPNSSRRCVQCQPTHAQEPERYGQRADAHGQGLFEQYSELSPKMHKELMMGGMVSDDRCCFRNTSLEKCPCPGGNAGSLENRVFPAP